MIPIAHCWAPVQRRWRYIVAGDVTLAEDNFLIPIIDVVFKAAGVDVEYLLDRGFHHTLMDPDELVTVLVPAVERDGMALLTVTMGARVIGAPEAAEDVA